METSEEAHMSTAEHPTPGEVEGGVTDRGSSGELRPGELVADRYVIERVIGCGGHGAIHRGRHRELDLPVAIKVLSVGGHTRSHRELAQRFLREAKITARIRHRNVLSVHDTGRLGDGSPFIVMELIEGEDLERRILRGPLSIAAIVDIARQMFAGLTAIAEAGVLHRDVKPANVMLHRQADGEVLLKLVDFGIARSRADLQRLTVTGAIVGTPHYMSPEQLRGEALDARADMYAASAVLYEATTGRPPFEGAATALVIGQILSKAPAPVRTLRPDCPEGLARVIERGLARKRSERPSHPMEVVAALDALVRESGLPARALAWAGDPGVALAAPIDLARRRLHTPTPPNVTDPPDGPLPISPMEDPVPPLEPERPDHIEDPPPQAPPRKARRRLLAAGAVMLSLVLYLAIGGARSESPAAVVRRAAPSLANESTLATTLAPAVAPSVPAAPDVEQLLQQGLEALARGELDAALSHYRAASQLDPGSAEAQRGRGIAAARAGLDDEAITALERYLALAPDASDAERVRVRLSGVRASRSARLVETASPPRAPRGVRRRIAR
jgi:serine/threonine protein kinase